MDASLALDPRDVPLGLHALRDLDPRPLATPVVGALGAQIATWTLL